jgi:hypothetical protein
MAEGGQRQLSYDSYETKQGVEMRALQTMLMYTQLPAAEA